VSAAANEDRAAARVERLVGELEGLGLDALLVESLVDLRYLTGFTGSSGLALVSAGAAPHRFLTDFRYTTQSAEEVRGPFERETVAGELREAVPRLLGAGPGRLGFDESKMTVRAHRQLAEKLDGGGWELVGCTGLVERLRAVKEPSEIAAIAAACELADEALKGVLEGGLKGRSEREVAVALETSMVRLGASTPSFPSIVASGPHGALPHAQPREERIAADVLVTIDWGAQLQGYCSDCTRTYATGEGVSARAREIYALVLEAQEKGLLAVTAGPTGREVDAAAREVIELAGEGERFGHGLGHGVGLEIHEAPRLSRTAGEERLVAGHVVTVEPGVYLPGELGVRIEDLVVVRPEGRDVLTSLPKGLTVIS
jgi:Xaa-Pro aminopeptidase